MDKLLQYSYSRIDSVHTEFKRYIWHEINWNNRLIIIKGARGVGKTTLLLQYIKENLNSSRSEVLFVSMDDLYFSKNNLVEFADSFVKRGGKYLFLDEIHKYQNWSQEIKIMYDYFPELYIIITGSSALDIYKGKADLSRRAIMYEMQGLSLREFLILKYEKSYDVLTFDTLISNPTEFITEINKEIKPLKYFEEYLKFGYYPFFREDEFDYHTRLKQIINQILEVDLPSIENIDFSSVQKFKKLLTIISEIVPFKPNILELSKQIGVSRETLMKYLYLLENSDLLMLLQSQVKGLNKMNKPEKIYLNNPNIAFAIADNVINIGNIRETFFYNQVKHNNKVNYTEKGDFIINDKYIIEIGGKSKTSKQITEISNAYIAADNIEYIVGNKIPLWLFGFLY